MITMKLSKTQNMWMARLRKGPRVLEHGHDAVRRLVNRGLAKITLVTADKGKATRRVLSLATAS